VWIKKLINRVNFVAFKHSGQCDDDDDDDDLN